MKLGIVTMPFATFAEVPLRAAAAASALALAPVAPPTQRDAVHAAPIVVVAAYPRARRAQARPARRASPEQGPGALADGRLSAAPCRSRTDARGRLGVGSGWSVASTPRPKRGRRKRSEHRKPALAG